MQPHLLGAGKGDESRAWMHHEGITYLGARSWQEIDNAWWHGSLLERFEKLISNCGRVAGGLKNNGISRHNGRCGHSHCDRQRKVPGRNHHADTQGNVAQVVSLSCYGREGLGLVQAQHLPGVELAEIDRFRHVGICFRPGLTDLIDHPGGKMIFALADDLGGIEQNGRSRLRRCVTPGLERLFGNTDGLVCQFRRTF